MGWNDRLFLNYSFQVNLVPAVRDKKVTVSITKKNKKNQEKSTAR